MAQIRISITDQLGITKTTVEVPDDVPMNQLIPALIESLNLPTSLSYRLDNTDSGQRIADDATLEESGVESGAVFSLSPEVTAGRS